MSRRTSRLIIDTHIKKKEIVIDYDIEKFFKLSWIEIFLVKAVCCSKRYQARKNILKAGKVKVNFYLEVLTYIKKMQEIDIIKYLFLSADQLFLFNFLSKPSVSTNDVSSQIYKEFEMEQKKNLSLTKYEIDQMHQCYTNILAQSELSIQDKKLINIIDAEIESMKI
jgi:hypothetical protein